MSDGSKSPMRAELVRRLGGATLVLAVWARFSEANYGAGLSLPFKVVFWSLTSTVVFVAVTARVRYRHRSKGD